MSSAVPTIADPARSAATAPPLRVLLFSPHLGEGGADRVIAKLARHLDRRRFAPALALVRRAGPFLADVPADVPVYEFGARRLATALPALVRVIRRERPDVVFSAGASNIIAAVAHRLAGSRARLVLSERSALRRSDRSRARLAAELPAKRLTYRRADVVAAVSEGVARDLASVLGLSPERIAVVGNPMVDEDLAVLAAMPVEHPWLAGGASAAEPVIVACGRLVEIKDYPTLLDAFARIRAARAAKLIVLGDGPLREELRARAARLGVGDLVDFVGFDKNPFRYFARARLLLHASRAEGLPGALIQAMACGLPVVSTDCDFGPREVIAAPGRDGFLVPVGDAAALADRALQLLADDRLRDAVSAEARRSAQRYETRASLARYEAAFSPDWSAHGGRPW
jgi:glycosyltransferase involved in cell wall biosynthesis